MHAEILEILVFDVLKNFFSLKIDNIPIYTGIPKKMIKGVLLTKRDRKDMSMTICISY